MWLEEVDFEGFGEPSRCFLGSGRGDHEGFREDLGLGFRRWKRVPAGVTGGKQSRGRRTSVPIWIDRRREKKEGMNEDLGKERGVIYRTEMVTFPIPRNILDGTS